MALFTNVLSYLPKLGPHFLTATGTEFQEVEYVFGRSSVRQYRLRQLNALIENRPLGFGHFICGFRGSGGSIVLFYGPLGGAVIFCNRLLSSAVVFYNGFGSSSVAFCNGLLSGSIFSGCRSLHFGFRGRLLNVPVAIRGDLALQFRLYCRLCRSIIRRYFFGCGCAVGVY